jgi:hypothetical protein
LYDGFKYKISHEGKLSEFIEVRNGVRQGCIFIPDHLSANIGQSYEKSERIKEKRNTLEYERLEDLNYADDICLFAQRSSDMEEKLTRLKEEAESAGLHINIKKSKGMRVNTSNTQKFSLEETEIEEVESFVYLGCVVSKTGGTE